MQIASTTANVTPVLKSADVGDTTQTTLISSLSQYQIIRRNGAVVVFAPNKVAVALMKAFLAVHGTQGAASASVRETVDGLTEAVVRALLRSRPGGGCVGPEPAQAPPAAWRTTRLRAGTTRRPRG